MRILCLGNPELWRDRFGPAVGTELERLGLQVWGTLQRPAHLREGGLDAAAEWLQHADLRIIVDAARWGKEHRHLAGKVRLHPLLQEKEEMQEMFFVPLKGYVPAVRLADRIVLWYVPRTFFWMRPFALAAAVKEAVHLVQEEEAACSAASPSRATGAAGL